MAVLPAAQDGAAPRAGMVCGAKRIRSLYLPWMPGVTPRFSTTTPPEGLALLSTINGAITPRRDAFAEQTSLPLLAHRGWKPLPQRSFSPSLHEDKDGRIRGCSR